MEREGGSGEMEREGGSGEREREKEREAAKIACFQGFQDLFCCCYPLSAPLWKPIFGSAKHCLDDSSGEM